MGARADRYAAPILGKAFMTLSLLLRQPSLFDSCPVAAAVESLATAGGVDERGAIFTRREVVDFILDLIGYTCDQPLHRRRMLEPSFGAGDFLLPIIERLLVAWRASGEEAQPLEALGNCICAVELHRDTFAQTRAAVVSKLVGAGIAMDAASAITNRWLVHGDFLLADLPGSFNVVAGNPPYVRQEMIPDVLLAEYRSRYRTVYDRADLYIPFIERSLLSLVPGGTLGFICADRWMKNRYGGPLRALVAEHFHLRSYIDMTDTPAFQKDVIAYPAITIISREPSGPTRIARQPAIERHALSQLSRDLAAAQLPVRSSAVRQMGVVTAGSEPWILGASDQLALVRAIEQRFPLISDVGCRVGIGVATGADKVFIGPMDELDVEEERKLPLVTTRDISKGTVQWQGLGVINPFADDGRLVTLGDYPKLKRYFESRKDQIAGRHCAQKTPSNWYRTIDRITPSLALRPKLLIPDIKGEANVVHESGHLYPHHNLYFITSDEWELQALRALLLSGIARLFVATYSTRMRGGFLRFQAQYLRRIRVPRWTDVSLRLQQELTRAGEASDMAACNRAAFELYGLSKEEWASLEGKPL